MDNKTTNPQPPEGFSKRDASNTASQLSTTNGVDHEITTTTQPRAEAQPLQIPVKPSVPPTTSATTHHPNIAHYIETSALISSHANLTDPLTILFQLEKPENRNLTTTRPIPPSTLLPLLITANTVRLQTKLTAGSLIAESASFATTACWTPSSHTAPPPPPSFFADLMTERPIFAAFLRSIERVREKHLYPISSRYWHLSLMARDPRREYVPGAVRAVVEPFLKIAEQEGVPAWLEAGSERARDVYGHFGFVVCDVIKVAGVETWCMIRRC